jgi:hypothetical protein
MKNNIILIIVLCSSFTSLYSQKNQLVFDSCKLSSFCIDCGNPKAEFNSESTLLSYFSLSLVNQREKINKCEGSIELQILVDTMGQACCKSISNNSSLSLSDFKALNLFDIVSKMPLWKPAIGKKGKISTSIILSLKFKETLNLVAVERVGFISEK